MTAPDDLTPSHPGRSAAATRLSSSLRSRSAEESLPLAAALAKSRGVTRVTDTTWLDCIGIPVFASIRPDGEDGSVCVHAGKGFTAAEAKIGAYMEAIEFSFASEGRSGVGWRMATPEQILESFKGRIQFVDFCARMTAKVNPGDQIACVEGEELLSGLGRVLLPADLVYHPFFKNPGARLYGTSTNGLASGNTLLEATVHGLAEVMERHVRSFDNLRDDSVLVDVAGATPKLRDMAERIERAGFDCRLRYSENEFGMAYFTGYVMERDETSPLAVASGFGFHPISEIAAIRALAEAVQSRLTYIHGGRDDLVKRFMLGEQLGRERELQELRKLRDRANNLGKIGNANEAAAGKGIPFNEVPDLDTQISSLQQAQDAMFETLKKVGMNHVASVTFTDPDYPFQVVKVVVPGAEMYEHELRRVGPRLIKRVRALKEERAAQQPQDAGQACLDKTKEPQNA